MIKDFLSNVSISRGDRNRFISLLASPRRRHCMSYKSFSDKITRCFTRFTSCRRYRARGLTKRISFPLKDGNEDFPKARPTRIISRRDISQFLRECKQTRVISDYGNTAERTRARVAASRRIGSIQLQGSVSAG